MQPSDEISGCRRCGAIPVVGATSLCEQCSGDDASNVPGGGVPTIIDYDDCDPAVDADAQYHGKRSGTAEW